MTDEGGVRSARPRRAPDIRDVARAAGVSHQTVSRVLNGHPNLRDSTRQRVLEAMEELRFRLNRAARALVTSESRIIGALTGALTGGLIMGVLNNGMSLMGVGIDFRQFIKGLVLLLAVGFDVFNKRRASNALK